MNNLCIIPARAGSKRLPGKNRLKNDEGEYIIENVYEIARLCGLFDNILLATNDNYLLQELRQEHDSIDIYNRSEENSQDGSTLSDLVNEILGDVIEDYNLVHYDNICVLYPLALFTTIKDLQGAYDVLQYHNFDAVMAVTEADNPQALFSLNGQGQLSRMMDEYAEQNSNDWKTVYKPAGQFFWVKTSVFKKEKTLIPGNTGGWFMKYAIDIDTKRDWDIVRAYLRGKG